MNKHAPTGEALRSLLHMDHFGSDPGPLPPADPLTRTTIHRVPIDQIDFYDRNPRRIRNPHYDEIKESIRASGILQNPKITFQDFQQICPAISKIEKITFSMIL